MTEIWKDIEGYEGYYQVSNLGRVKSLERRSSAGRRINDKILKNSINSVGYYRVCLCKNGKGKAVRVHQLVAIAFLGHVPCGYNIIVDHIDNDPLNNNVDNLQLTTPRHNLSKDKKGGTSKYTGVCWDKKHGKWHSVIGISGKNKHLGYFDCEIKASKAYQKELNKLKK